MANGKFNHVTQSSQMLIAKQPERKCSKIILFLVSFDKKRGKNTTFYFSVTDC